MTIDEAIDIAGRLAKHLREAKAIQPLLAKDADAIDTIIVELDRLRSALPRTADGVTIVPNVQTVVWVNWNGKQWPAIGEYSSDAMDNVEWCGDPWKYTPRQDYVGPDWFKPSECYSTEAAARAAALDAGSK